MRLIDADALLNKCYHAYPSIDHYCTSRSVVDTKDVINTPTIDAVPVVRCADCRHFRCNLRPDGYLPEGVGETECTLFYCGMDYTDFCSHAERRNDETD